MPQDAPKRPPRGPKEAPKTAPQRPPNCLRQAPERLLTRSHRTSEKASGPQPRHAGGMGRKLAEAPEKFLTKSQRTSQRPLHRNAGTVTAWAEGQQRPPKGFAQHPYEHPRGFRTTTQARSRDGPKASRSAKSTPHPEAATGTLPRNPGTVAGWADNHYIIIALAGCYVFDGLGGRTTAPEAEIHEKRPTIEYLRKQLKCALSSSSASSSSSSSCSSTFHLPTFILHLWSWGRCRFPGLSETDLG